MIIYNNKRNQKRADIKASKKAKHQTKHKCNEERKRLKSLLAICDLIGNTFNSILDCKINLLKVKKHEISFHNSNSTFQVLQ